MRAIADLAVPRICVCCGRTLALHEEHICSDCLADLPRCRFGKLRLNPMSEALNALLQRVDGDSYRPFSYALALFFYRGNYRRITQALKYKRNFKAGSWAAGLLAEELRKSPFFQDVDLIVPVPLHWWRRWQRGYNQAGLIAAVLADELGIPIAKGLLSRRRATRSQTRLSKEGRYANVRTAFQVNRNKLQKFMSENGIHHLLLLDDVFTTGATLAACSQALSGTIGTLSPGQEGKVRISVATLAAVIP